MPAVSILLPVRNAAHTLEAAVRSCLQQTFSDFELLMANDGSTDATADLILHLTQLDSRIRSITVPPPGGLVSAHNLLAQEATAPLLARMDADDTAHPERLEEQLQLMNASPDLAACGCGVRIRGAPSGADVNPQAGFRRYEKWINALTEPEAIARERFIESPMVHPTALIRAEALQAVGGYHDTTWAEDYDLWLRMLDRGMRLAKVPRVLLTWNDSPGRLTRTHPRYSRECFMDARAFYLSRLDRIRNRGVSISGAGPTGKALARRLLTRNIPIHTFLDIHPRRTGTRILGIPVRGADELETANPDTPIQLSAVGRPGRRDAVRSIMRAKGYREGLNFFCVA